MRKMLAVFILISCFFLAMVYIWSPEASAQTLASDHSTTSKEALPVGSNSISLVQSSLGTSFTYQGQFNDNNAPANGLYDFRFILYNSDVDGSQVGSTLFLNDHSVSNGLFTTSLDFGSVFDGTALWLEISVRPGASMDVYTVLSPRQSFTAVPYATNALQAQDLLPYSTSIDLYGANSTIGGRGVYGYASATSGTSDGVWGRSDSSQGRGVLGWATNTSGTNYGVWGQTDSIDNDASGVYGWASSALGGAGQLTKGVTGISEARNGTGVYGVGNGSLGFGVQGKGYWGVNGVADNTSGSVGVVGSSGPGRGVWGSAGAGVGVYGDSQSGYAGYFSGDVEVTGSFVNALAATKIDHPLDPANKYLNHFSQQAPEVQNVYNGNATLDDKGEAIVTLPAYFEAINGDSYRYQLTAIGAAMPELHIGREIQDGAFLIAGGAPGMTVSWEVTANRNDPYLRDHLIPTEQDKPAEEVGTYLYPQGYGQPKELDLNYQEKRPWEQN